MNYRQTIVQDTERSIRMIYQVNTTTGSIYIYKESRNIISKKCSVFAVFAVTTLMDFNSNRSVKRYLDTIHSIKQSSVQDVIFSFSSRAAFDDCSKSVTFYSYSLHFRMFLAI